MPAVITITIKLLILISVCQTQNANPIHTLESKKARLMQALAAFRAATALLHSCSQTLIQFYMVVLLQSLAFLVRIFHMVIWPFNFTHSDHSVTTAFQIKEFSFSVPVKHKKSPFGLHIHPFSSYIHYGTLHSYEVFCQYLSLLSGRVKPQWFDSFLNSVLY